MSKNDKCYKKVWTCPAARRRLEFQEEFLRDCFCLVHHCCYSYFDSNNRHCCWRDIECRHVEIAQDNREPSRIVSAVAIVVVAAIESTGWPFAEEEAIASHEYETSRRVQFFFTIGQDIFLNVFQYSKIRQVTTKRIAKAMSDDFISIRILLFTRGRHSLVVPKNTMPLYSLLVVAGRYQIYILHGNPNPYTSCRKRVSFYINQLSWFSSVVS